MGAKCCTPPTLEREINLLNEQQDDKSALMNFDSLTKKSFNSLVNQTPPEASNSKAKLVSLMLPMAKKSKFLKKRRQQDIEKLKTQFLEKERPIFGPYSYTHEGVTYKGNYLSGLRQGFGFEINDEGDYYIGQYDKDRKQGQGLYIHGSGEYYLGEFSEGNPHGKGTFYWNRTNFYEGNFVKGNINGKGVITWENQVTYKGDFLNGVMHGKGIHRKNPNIAWEDEELWKKDQYYMGEMMYGKISGEGVFYWPDGKRFEGSFLDGKMNGDGIKYNQEGKSIERGSWKEGKRVIKTTEPNSNLK